MGGQYGQRLVRVALGVLLLAAVSTPVPAENIDPQNDGSQYAYAENVGWLNAEPGGDGGPGIEVGDLALTGYMWGENTGWISLSCTNTASCGTVNYGVTNDGGGVLSGYAWAENTGWISFSCVNTSSCGTTSYGVAINPATGDFSGRAWGENIGWITFASSAPVAYKVKADWPACSAPSNSPVLAVTKAGSDTQLDWGVLPGASSYDVVRGDLGALRGTAGDFAAATQSCVVNDGVSTSATAPGNPPLAGDGFWFLVRGVDCAAGTYDSSGSFQSAGRDAEILASGNDCP